MDRAKSAGEGKGNDLRRHSGIGVGIEIATGLGSSLVLENEV